MRMAKALRRFARNQTSETKFSRTPHQFLGCWDRCLGWTRGRNFICLRTKCPFTKRQGEKSLQNPGWHLCCENCSFLSSPVFRTGKFIPRRVLCTVQPFQCCTEIQNHFGMASGSSCCKSSGDWKPLNPLSLDPICLLTSLGPGVSLKLFDPSSLPWKCCIDFPWSAAKICFIQLGQRCLKTWLGSCESWAKCFPFCTSTCLRIGEISVDVSKLPGCWSFQSECLLQLGHEL